MNFIRASEDFCTLEKRVPAPYFRRNFTVSKELSGATLTITGLGYYKAFINGKEITKGFLAPYRSNIDHFIYCDKYDLTDILKSGKNTLGIILGNGLRNAWGGFIWDFDKAVFRGAPITAFSLELLYSDGAKETIISDSQTKTAPSPILYDDLHTGEMFDARLQIPDWASPVYEDGNWSFAIKAEAPRGELKICEAELAYNMITRPDFPSYGNCIARGATTLWEEFYPEKGEGDLVRISSHNHHFWGDVSAWFYRYLAGINVNPHRQDANNVNIEPVFIHKLDFVKASYTAKDGTVAVDWKRENDTIVINTKLTGKVYGKIILPNGFAFEDNSREKELKTAEYTAFKLKI